MTRDPKALTPEMQIAHALVVSLCKAAGFPLTVYCTLRTCEEQAELYRATRTRAEINSKMQSLTARGFDFLAAVIEDVGPQSGTLGQHKTKAGPGESFHQWGEAFDAAPRDGGNVIWDTAHPGYASFGHACKLAQLTWGGSWGWDFPHAQLRPAKNPLTGQADPDIVRAHLLQIGSLNAS